MTGSALHIGIHTTDDMVIVTPVGVLSLETAVQLRTTLLRCLAAQPDAVIVDLRLLHVRASHLLMIVPGVARLSAEWTGTELVLATGPVAPLGSGQPNLRTSALARFVRIFPDVTAAQRAVARTATTRRVEHHRLPPTPRAVSDARQFIAAGCRRWGCQALTDDAESIGAELVANAVLHTHDEVVLSLELRPRLLTIAVADHSEAPARLSPAAGDRRGEPPDHGYGLRIVDGLAEGWSSAPAPGGKTVWATLAVR